MPFMELFDIFFGQQAKEIAFAHGIGFIPIRYFPCSQDAKGDTQAIKKARHRAGDFLGGSYRVDETADVPTSMECPGTQIGPYTLREQIGEGGMASVFKAYQPGLDREVALKVLPPRKRLMRSWTICTQVSDQ